MGALKFLWLLCDCATHGVWFRDVGATLSILCVRAFEWHFRACTSYQPLPANQPLAPSFCLQVHRGAQAAGAAVC